MSRTETIREAAAVLVSDDPGISFDRLRTLVSEWMRAEALLTDGFVPMVDLFNLELESATGVRSYLRLGKREDGEIATQSETTNHAENIATIIAGAVK